MALPRFLVRQVGKPHGWFAPAIAWLLNRSNAIQNLEAVAALQLNHGERVLDLGFGGGVALDALLGATAGGCVFAIDPSREMVARARRRHGAAVQSGALVVREGDAGSIPLADATVDAALSVNTVYFWSDVQVGLGELRRVLRPGGRLCLGIATPEHCQRMGFHRHGLHVRSIDSYCGALSDAGFVEVEARDAATTTHASLVRARVPA
ncbi:MAG: methyltransferase domain-containing protein [Myxococcales bacterium]|nr:methyltransferase domain-containing protein [Myxococcales bacterium]